MSHFYDCRDTHNPEFLDEIGSPAKALSRSRYVYPSVTTVLSIIKDPFLDSIWKPRMMCELSREYPDLDWRDVERRTYGMRSHPETGEEIESSEFGTAVHKRIESMLDTTHSITSEDIDGAEPYDSWAVPFIEWVEENNVEPVAAEHIVSNRRLKIAGSIDFLGWHEGKLFLADYKCRTNTNGRAKTYNKDCQQLAIESFMVMKENNLDYLPECLSVIIDCDTKKHHHKWWSKNEMDHGIKVAKKCSELYWLTRMKTK